MKQIFLLTLSVLFTFNLYAEKAENRLDGINTFVGTRSGTVKTTSIFGQGEWMHGQTIPAVLQPNGMTFWTPQTSRSEQRGTTPYYYESNQFMGFRNSHWIAGGNTQDYGSFGVLPVMDKLPATVADRVVEFSHEDEEGHPDYYAVNLPKAHVRAEMTGLSHSGIFRVTWQKDGTGYLIVNPNTDEGEGLMTIDTARHRIYGYNPVRRIYQGWGEYAGIACYYVLEYPEDVTVTKYGTYVGNDLSEDNGTVANHKDMGCYIAFKVKKEQQVVLKVSNSFVSFEGALANLDNEIPHWDFDKTRQQLRQMWLRQLAIIDVEDPDVAKVNQFYGALYRASFLPREFSDVDGRYPSFGGGGKILQMPAGEKYYNDFSLWDTFRAMHPLINILWPTKSGDMITSLLKMGEQGGFLPIFPAWNSYTSEMIGDPCLSLIGDAYIKGIRNFDIQKAYAAMRRNAFEQPDSYEEYRLGKGRRALESYLRYGYIPLEDSVKEAFHREEQMSRTLEYAYDDFAMAQVAKALGKKEDYAALMGRATNYRNVIDTRTGYVQGRHADGSFINEENIAKVSRFVSEGAPCHYTWYVPQDPYGLMKLMGGRERYVAKLDSLFDLNWYWHGNEPCHQIAYMYNFAGEPWKTQQRVHKILSTEYADTSGGLSGNDDAGQMSSWYIFSTLGFYPVCPSTPYYMLGAPAFKKVVIHLENNKKFTIEAPDVDSNKFYVQKVTRNGKAYTRNYISHDDIVNGATFRFVLGSQPNKTWGTKRQECPFDMMKKGI